MRTGPSVKWSLIVIATGVAGIISLKLLDWTAAGVSMLGKWAGWW